jgi:hypothetical protein
MPTIRKFPPGNGPEGATQVPLFPEKVGSDVVATPKKWTVVTEVVATPADWVIETDPITKEEYKALRRGAEGSMRIISVKEKEPKEKAPE